MKHNFTLRLRHLLALPILLFLVAISLVGRSQTVTVSTDMDDYYPGEWVIITGSGWKNDSTVQLTLTHLDPLPDPIHTHEIWMVQPNAEGYIYSEWFVEEQELGTSFDLTALGMATGLAATTYFTDSPRVGSIHIGTQTPNPLIVGSSATYDIFVSRGSGTGSSGPFNAYLSISTTLPPGVTATFSPYPVHFSFVDYNKKATLTFTTDASITPAATTAFTVKALSFGNDFKIAYGELIVKSNTPIITWSNPIDIIYGSTLSATQLNAIANVPGTFVYSPASGTILNTGNGQILSVTFTPNDTKYNTVSKSVLINVEKADQAIIWNNPENIVYGMLLSATQLNASITGTTGGTEPDALTYTPPIGTLLNAGSQILHVDAAATSNYNAANINVTIVVDKAPSTTVVSVANVTFDGNAHGATASVTGVGGLFLPLIVTYTGIAPTVYGPSATAPTNVGTYTASSSFAGDTNHDISSDSKPFTINPAVASITIAGGTWTYDANEHGASITEAKGVVETGEDLSSDVTLGAKYINVPGGTAHWSFSNPNYVPQSGIVEITIDKADATVTINGYTGVYDELAHGATGSAKGVNNERLSGLNLGDSFTNVPGGTAHWTFTGGINYLNESGDMAIVINKASSTTAVSVANATFDGNTHGATAFVTGVGGLNQPLIVTYSGVAPTVYAASTTAPTNAGTYTAAASFAGDLNHEVSSDSKPFTIAKAPSQTLVTIASGPFTYTGSAITPATVSVTGVGGLNLTPTADYVNNVNAGTATASYSFAGDDNHLSSSDSKTFAIDKANAIIIVNKYDLTYNGLPHTSSFTASGVETPTPVDLASLMTVSGTTHTNAGEYTGDTWSFAGNDNYNVRSGSVDNNISPRPITITAEAKSKYIWQDDPLLTFNTDENLVDGDSFSGYLTREQGMCPGNYKILQGSLQNTNYSIEYNEAIFTVKNVTIDASQSSLPIQLNTQTTTLKASVFSLSSEPIDGLEILFAVDGIGITPFSGKAVTGVGTNKGEANLTVNTSTWPIGLYKIVATVVSDCNVTVSSTAYMTVYDPNGSFIAGGGWINSPDGALVGTNCTGKANFGFNAKYKKGKTLVAEVEGNTEFQFQTGNFNFKSNMLSSGTLVISGAKATFRGEGTVNGTGQYGFMVSAVDGQINGGGNIDKFRIKIWDKYTRTTVYDNLMGIDENATLDNTTILGGGSIVIHEVKPKSAEITPETSIAPFEATLKVYPNPFTERLNIEFGFATDTKGKLEIYSVTGAKLQTLYDGPVTGCQVYNFEYLPHLVSSQVVLYHLTLDGKTQVGKVLYNERR